ncbi:MAG: two pore domain potassium channel family protein [Rhodobacteraceae bacterium]|nr:two pore domain potassium channel family protein [Paracoccaceae bacterium]
MLVQFSLGLIMTALTIAIGAVAIVVGGEPLRRRRAQLSGENHLVHHIVAITLVASVLVIAMLLIMLLWAMLLVGLGIFPEFELALYFSMISFTTLGFGDVILPDEWRLLAGFIAADGFFIFGLNTAFVFEVFRRLREINMDG